eukprot:2124603-Rhodomonas_salina.1
MFSWPTLPRQNSCGLMPQQQRRTSHLIATGRLPAEHDKLASVESSTLVARRRRTRVGSRQQQLSCPISRAREQRSLGLGSYGLWFVPRFRFPIQICDECLLSGKQRQAWQWTRALVCERRCADLSVILVIAAGHMMFDRRGAAAAAAACLLALTVVLICLVETPRNGSVVLSAALPQSAQKIDASANSALPSSWMTSSDEKDSPLLHDSVDNVQVLKSVLPQHAQMPAHPQPSPPAKNPSPAVKQQQTQISTPAKPAAAQPVEAKASHAAKVKQPAALPTWQDQTPSDSSFKAM